MALLHVHVHNNAMYRHNVFHLCSKKYCAVSVQNVVYCIKVFESLFNVNSLYLFHLLMGSA